MRLALAAAALLLFGTVPPSLAQVTSGSVSGAVRDTQGAVIPAAPLTLVSETRGTSLETTSNENGDFVFPNVAADTYTLRVALEGFKTLERRGVMVSPGDRVALGIVTIDIGAVTETVSIMARATELQAQSAERSYAVEGKAVQNIAMNGRSFFGLAFLAPGVVTTGNTPTGDAATMSANGQRSAAAARCHRLRAHPRCRPGRGRQNHLLRRHDRDATGRMAATHAR